ncbi:hypothetical protein Gotur_002192 [Gossypium turneri]
MGLPTLIVTKGDGTTLSPFLKKKINIILLALEDQVEQA